MTMKQLKKLIYRSFFSWGGMYKINELIDTLRINDPGDNSLGERCELPYSTGLRILICLFV